ncbi:MAG: hypothetical protein ACI9MC_000222 [Kiritimatiellia bacterium]
MNGAASNVLGFTALPNICVEAAPEQATQSELVRVHQRSCERLGCEPSVSVAELIASATSEYDAFVELVVGRVEQRTIRVVGSESHIRRDQICWELSDIRLIGIAVSKALASGMAPSAILGVLLKAMPATARSFLFGLRQ